ncbi:7-methylguanosine phosphate-specific 5'-nucleotidase-like [Camelus bactrianus]|uniref:7-methylguanosine phosphate-specific 5'-nucleotidase-like n=1 Tax=Camelus bactrianus TaxID=9837 RepID=A0AC58NKI9_CAMBA
MKATVLMRQPGLVQEIVGALRRGGGDRLQVPPGARWGRPGGVGGWLGRLLLSLCWGKPDVDYWLFSSFWMSQLKALLHHYYPVEIDPHWTIKENLPHMVEWWTKVHALLWQQKVQGFQRAPVVRVRCNTQVSCLLWKTFLPYCLEWVCSQKRRLGRSGVEFVAGRVRRDMAP